MAGARAVSMFAGGGGLTLGMAQAGFDTILATDIEHSAAETFRRNLPQVPFLEQDARHFTRLQLCDAVGNAPIDLLYGGPPCQGFSTLGAQNPADPRNGLFWSFARAVDWLRPSCFLMENVNYLRTQYGGRYEKEIIAVFEGLGYHVWVETLNAADFGVPQIRKRVFFFGSRFDTDFAWPQKSHGPGLEPYETVGKTIGDLAWVGADVPNHVHLNHSRRVVQRYQLIPEGGRMPPPSELPLEIRRKNFGNTYKRLHRDRSSLTLVPGNNAFPVHPTEDRSLSPREAARLQTFPDSHVFAGNRAEQCRLVGNAVPVLLAKKLGQAIATHLREAVQDSLSSVRQPPRPLQLIGPSKMTFERRQKALTGVSFFTGAGGLLLGFLNAGTEVLASYDMKSSVERNAALNFPSVKHVKADVATITAEDVHAGTEGRNIDVVFGGPPCQGFSIFGRRRFVNTRDHRPERDERNELSLKFIELAIKLNPRMILMENVKGFVSTQRGSSTYLGEVERLLTGAGYNFDHKVINCAAYGVPQARERFILVAYRTENLFIWPEPRYFPDPKPWQQRALWVGDVISDLMDPETHSQVFSHVPMNHKPLVVERYKLIPEGGKLPESTMPDELRQGYRSANVKNYSHVYRRLSMKAPATTMVPGHNAFPVHPILNRTLTVREAARIQTFPDWMRFVGTRQQQCTLVGNAVPPALAEIFANSIVKALEGKFSHESYKRDVYDLAAAS